MAMFICHCVRFSKSWKREGQCYLLLVSLIAAKEHGMYTPMLIHTKTSSFSSFNFS